METKKLRFEGIPGKQENDYVMTLTVPGKYDMLNLIEKPPFHVLSKHDTTFSTGILAYVPHSMKLRISRDYQEPYIGVYIRITPKPEEIIEMSEIKGSFTIEPAQSQELSSMDAGMCANDTFYNSQFCAKNNNNVLPTTQDEQVVNISFFKSSISRLPELENYEYYESRCHWPHVPSQVNISLKILKTTYSVLVNDDFSSEFNGEPKNSVSSMSYFLSDVFSDVSIQVGDEVFPAHKIILSERSRFFSRMFANSMRESNEGVVRLVEEDDSLFREILRFIYQGTVENLEENASELYILSDKYDIPDLSALCEKYLLNQLSVENAMEMFDLSQSVMSQGMLAKKSKETIMWNKDKFASNLEAFKDFSQKYPEIIFELLQL